MEPKKNRSIGLIIRRFFAIFIIFSTASGIIAQIESRTFTNETIGSAFVSLLIAYYLARSPRNNQQNPNTNVEKNNDEFDDDVDMKELLEEFEESLEGSPNSFVRYNSKLNTYTVPLIKSQSDFRLKLYHLVRDLLI